MWQPAGGLSELISAENWRISFHIQTHFSFCSVRRYKWIWAFLDLLWTFCHKKEFNMRFNFYIEGLFDLLAGVNKVCHSHLLLLPWLALPQQDVAASSSSSIFLQLSLLAAPATLVEAWVCLNQTNWTANSPVFSKTPCFSFLLYIRTSPWYFSHLDFGGISGLKVREAGTWPEGYHFKSLRAARRCSAEMP